MSDNIIERCADDFQRIGKRFRSIEAVTDVDGNRYVKRLAAQAARLFYRGRAAGATGIFALEWAPPPVEKHFIPDNGDRWWVAWQIFLTVLATIIPDRIPRDVGIPDIQNNERGSGFARFNAKHWRERAHDYAAACDVMAEYLRNAVPVAIKPDSRMDEILQVLLESGAVTLESKMTSDEIASKIAHNADANSLKRPIAHLFHKRLIQTFEGRGGGCFLTEQGRRTAEHLETVRTVT